MATVTTAETVMFQVPDGITLYLGLPEQHMKEFEANGHLMPKSTQTGSTDYFSLRHDPQAALDRAKWFGPASWYSPASSIQVVEIYFTNAGYMHFTSLETLKNVTGGWHHFYGTLFSVMHDSSEPPQLLYRCAIRAD